MTATIYPFPATRRRSLIKKTAGYMASTTASVAESHLKNQLSRLESRLRKAGVSETAILGERRAYEAAIRSELWRQVLTPGGAA
ncbi:DUF6074 family protein [Microvirga antarctica]|uniref:DUF6074 family protein n=1 Tax=Microvirga antarctica TaxID=2819233 RepID=UPI001FE9FF6E|nr:DUF6074 family protein [Microvirga antarctica]